MLCLRVFLGDQEFQSTPPCGGELCADIDAAWPAGCFNPRPRVGANAELVGLLDD